MRANGNWFYLSQTQMMEKFEKNPVTRNLNKANTGYQWSSTSGSGSIASGDRGLGLEKKYYINLSEIKIIRKEPSSTSFRCRRRRRKNHQIIIFIRRLFRSRKCKKKLEPSGNKVAKSQVPQIFKKLQFADKDGNLTGSYTKVA